MLPPAHPMNATAAARCHVALPGLDPRRGIQIKGMGLCTWLTFVISTRDRFSLSMNLGWFGVAPLGGSNGLGRLKPGLQAVRGSWSQCAASKSWRLSRNSRSPAVERRSCRVGPLFSDGGSMLAVAAPFVACVQSAFFGVGESFTVFGQVIPKFSHSDGGFHTECACPVEPFFAQLLKLAADLGPVRVRRAAQFAQQLLLAGQVGLAKTLKSNNARLDLSGQFRAYVLPLGAEAAWVRRRIVGPEALGQNDLSHPIGNVGCAGENLR